MEISRNVIMDLLPLYFANELSEDSRALVEQYLKADPELARLARQTAATALSEKTPTPITQNGELSAYRKARRVIMWRTIALAVIVAVFLVLILAMFFLSSSSSISLTSTLKKTEFQTGSPNGINEELRYSDATHERMMNPLEATRRSWIITETTALAVLRPQRFRPTTQSRNGEWHSGWLRPVF